MPCCDRGVLPGRQRSESGKLAAVARYWAAGGHQQDYSEADRDAAAFGVIWVRDDAPPDECEVWEENWETVVMFMRLQTQWRTTMAGYQGLDYGTVQWLLGLYHVSNPVEMLEGLQVMESAALQELNRDG